MAGKASVINSIFQNVIKIVVVGWYHWTSMNLVDFGAMLIRLLFAEGCQNVNVLEGVTTCMSCVGV